MKKLTFLMMSFVALTTTTVLAQDAIHGVDGYYNWTPKQMQADNLINFATNPTAALPADRSSIEYFDDYVKFNMAVKYDGNNFRGDWSIINKYDGANPLVITKKYPVLAVKIGYAPLPQNMTGGDFSGTIAWKYRGDSTIYYAAVAATASPDGKDHAKNALNFKSNKIYYPASSYYINTPNGKGGWDDNSRMNMSSWQKDTLNNYYHKYNVRMAIGDSVNTASTTSSTNQGYLAVDDAIAPEILYINLQPVFERDETLFGIDKNIEVISFGAVMTSFFCDTTMIVNKLNEAGDSIGVETIAKPRELMPYYNIKWIKTFESVTALTAASKINAGDGNDSRSDAQLSLNAALYAAKMTLENYDYADPMYVEPYQSAYEVALAIYKTTAPSEDRTSAEWIAWDVTVTNAITELTAARGIFKYGITNNITEPYNLIKAANGSSEFMVGANATVGGVSCKLIGFGGEGSGTPLVFSKSSTTVGGLTAYSLSSAAGKVCIVKDTLVFVENAKYSSAAPIAYFVFSNRAENAEPFYDILVNGKYVVISETTGKITTANEIPTGDIRDLGNYLFDISKAIYDTSNDNPNLEIFNAWEFNDATFGDWEKNTWRNYGTITSRTKGDNTYAILGTIPTYYAIQDSTSSVLLTTDYNLEAGPNFRRESGTYASKDTRRLSTQDSSLITWSNTYRKRYFAMKSASIDGVAKITNVIFATGLNGDVSPTFNQDNKLGQKGDVAYWDMLDLGMPYGDKGWANNYMGTVGFTSERSEIYLDWMRTYATIDEIPTELVDINTSVKRNYEGSIVQVLIIDKNVTVKTEKVSTISIMNLSGQVLSSAIGTEVVFPVTNAGVYIVTSLENNQLVTRKVMVK